MKRSAPSSLQSHAGFWLRFVSNHVSQQFAARLEGSGVTVAEWVLLREMFDVEVTAPSALAQAAGLSRGAVSKLIDRLLAKKLVMRSESVADRRFQDVRLTAAGRAIVPELAALADQNDAEFFSCLSERRRKELVSTLKKLVEANRLTAFPVD